MSEPRKVGILDLLIGSSGAQFVIPVYQRNYTWKANSEVKQYLEDLENILNGRYKSHFLGIFIYLEKNINYASREYSVIDGQQRLTTTFLLLYAIKHLLMDEGNREESERLNGQFLINPYSENVKYKLKPSVSDDDAYKCIVENRLEDTKDKNNSNVYKNYEYIIDSLKNNISANYQLTEILDALRHFYVVVIPVSEEENPQKIFESINATGVKLTSADLIKNYLLMNMSSIDQENYYSKYWEKIEESVSKESKELEVFFRMYLAIKKFELVSKGNVYKEFVFWTEKNSFNILDLFDDLLQYAKIYYFIRKQNLREIPKELKEQIIDFRKVNSDLILPLYMELVKLYKNSQLNAEKLNKCMLIINSYMIRRSICDFDSQNISRLFPKVLKKVIEKSNHNYEKIDTVLSQELVAKNVNTSKSFMPTDKQMEELLSEANVYQRPALRIILDKIEIADNPAPVDLSSLSVEHLMPQTPTEEWLEELDTAKEEYDTYLHRLGNLTLAAKSDNSKMQNYMWDYKNEILRSTGHLKLNSDLLEIKRWDFDEIKKRTKKLITRICEIYPYPEIDLSDIHDEDKDIVNESTALETSRKKLFEDKDVSYQKNRIIKTKDNLKGYIFNSSKRYFQGGREKYWFGYRVKNIEEISMCREQYQVLVCRGKDTIAISIPIPFIEQIKDCLNYSLDNNGKISHYHLVVFVDECYAALLLSKPELTEIDISNYII